MPSKRASKGESSAARRWFDAAGMLVFVVVLYLLLRDTPLFNLSSNAEGAVSLGAIFVIGLVAASSTCLAVVGGLLLSVSARWADDHQRQSRLERVRPMLLFNAGRLIGYFVLGGIVGMLGTAITLTPRMTGYLTLLLAVVMVILGLNILRVLPKKYCRIPLPQSLIAKIKGLSQSQSAIAPLLLGAVTFFIPCGFTQSMQLLALSSGSFLHGGVIMLAFAFGTLPALLGISLIGTLAEGRTMRFFLRFSGAVVLLLGVFNLHNGLALAGINTDGVVRAIMGTSAPDNSPDDPYVSIAEDGRQIVSLYVSDLGYSPSDFTIEPGRETWVYAVAKNALSGCANFLVSPSHNLSTIVNKGGNWLGPIKNPKNDFMLTCSMGRLRANVRVKKS